MDTGNRRSDSRRGQAILRVAVVCMVALVGTVTGPSGSIPGAQAKFQFRPRPKKFGAFAPPKKLLDTMGIKEDHTYQIRKGKHHEIGMGYHRLTLLVHELMNSSGGYKFGDSTRVGSYTDMNGGKPVALTVGMVRELVVAGKLGTENRGGYEHGKLSRLKGGFSANACMLEKGGIQISVVQATDPGSLRSYWDLPSDSANAWQRFTNSTALGSVIGTGDLSFGGAHGTSTNHDAMKALRRASFAR